MLKNIVANRYEETQTQFWSHSESQKNYCSPIQLPTPNLFHDDAEFHLEFKPLDIGKVDL